MRPLLAGIVKIDSLGLAKVDGDVDGALGLFRSAEIAPDRELDAFSCRNEPLDLLVSGARFLKDGEELSVRIDSDEHSSVGIGQERAVTECAFRLATVHRRLYASAWTA